MKLILQVILILLVVSTISICAIKPDMHKNVIVYDSAYTLVPEKQVEVETKEIPVMEKVVTPQKTTTIVQNNVVKKEIKTQTPKTTVKQQTTPKTTTKTKTETKVQPKITVTQNTQTKKIEKPIVKEVIKNPSPPTPLPQVARGDKIQPKLLTQQEETIAWNVWRSNLQNKIMQDTKLPIMPAGIVFKFSFSVDKYGKVSNVQTWSETPAYTPYAIQYIAPVIRSYQGRAILNFPSGTQRTATNVTGGWRISANEKFSTPHDYNDVEKVVR